LWSRPTATLLGLFGLLLASAATAQTGAAFTGRFIVKFKESTQNRISLYRCG